MCLKLNDGNISLAVIQNKVSLVICSPWHITPVAPFAGYNENCTFYFAGTTFITVRQN